MYAINSSFLVQHPSFQVPIIRFSFLYFLVEQFFHNLFILMSLSIKFSLSLLGKQSYIIVWFVTILNLIIFRYCWSREDGLLLTSDTLMAYEQTKKSHPKEKKIRKKWGPKFKSRKSKRLKREETVLRTSSNAAIIYMVLSILVYPKTVLFMRNIYWKTVHALETLSKCATQ